MQITCREMQRNSEKCRRAEISHDLHDLGQLDMVDVDMVDVDNGHGEHGHDKTKTTSTTTQ